MSLTFWYLDEVIFSLSSKIQILPAYELNGLDLLPFLELFIINFGDMKMKNWSKSVDSTGPGTWPGSILVAKVGKSVTFSSSLT
jgi:hypothetical protein